MTLPKPIPGPSANMERALRHPIVATGDYTEGAAEDMFTMTGHGLDTGAPLRLLYKAASGVVAADVSETLIAIKLTADTFQVSLDGETPIENSADGIAVWLDLSYPE